MPTTAMPIRVALRDARKEKDLTQAELAERVGVQQSAISRIEKGRTTAIDLPLLERICRVLEKQPGDLLILENAPKRGKK